MGSTGGLTRWENNGCFVNAAQFIATFLNQYAPPREDRAVLDVGCGRGWVVNNLRALGIHALGCEYSRETVEHSVCESTWADLTDRLPYPDAFFDMVICLGVLSHLPEKYLLCALDELRRVSRRFVWTNILVVPSEDQAHHLTVMSKAWWTLLFEGWHPVGDQLLERFGLRDSPTQWSQVWQVR